MQAWHVRILHEDRHGTSHVTLQKELEIKFWSNILRVIGVATRLAPRTVAVANIIVVMIDFILSPPGVLSSWFPFCNVCCAAYLKND